MTSAQPTGQIGTLVDRAGAARAQLIAAAVASLMPSWRAVDPYSPSAVGAFADAAAATSQSAQDRARQLAEAYLRTVLNLLQASPPTSTPVPTGTPARRDVDPTVVYGRPAETVRYARSLGVAPSDATDRGTRRLQQIVETDVALASRDASHTVLAASDKVTGWRRVLRPELARGGSCGLCIVASDRIYSRGDLLAIHDGCNCIPLPITRSHDPGVELNGADLATVYSAAGGSTSDRQKLQRVRIHVVQHGELGPVLANADHKFRGPDDVAA